MYNLIAIVLERVQSNPVFSGGVGLGLLGLALAMLSAATLAILRFLLRRISVTVTVDSRAPAYRHLALWLSDSGALKRSRRFKIAQFAPPDRFLPPEDLNIVFSPAEGRHWFWRGGAPAWVEYHMERSVPGESVIGHSAPLESLTVCVFFRRRAVIERWIASGARLAGVRRLGGPRVFSVSRQGEWRERGEVRPRSIEGIVTNGDWAQRVLSDARDFLDREHWYASRGIPWRRGYLLYGPPGTGKSSLIRAIATELHLNVATLDLGRHALDESDLREAMVW